MDSDLAESAGLPCTLTELFVIYPDRHTVRLIEGAPAPWPPREPFCPSDRSRPRMHRRAKPQPPPCRVRPKSARLPDLRKPLQREIIRIISIMFKRREAKLDCRFSSKEFNSKYVSIMCLVNFFCFNCNLIFKCVKITSILSIYTSIIIHFLKINLVIFSYFFNEFFLNFIK